MIITFYGTLLRIEGIFFPVVGIEKGIFIG